jgi:sec-independent protein translocase protein TatA
MGDLFSGGHIILILLVVLLLFGGKKIPELMRGLGRGIREFKDAKDNVKREIEDNMNHDQPPVNNSANTSTPVTKENAQASQK